MSEDRVHHASGPLYLLGLSTKSELSVEAIVRGMISLPEISYKKYLRNRWLGPDLSPQSREHSQISPRRCIIKDPQINNACDKCLGSQKSERVAQTNLSVEWN